MRKYLFALCPLESKTYTGWQVTGFVRDRLVATLQQRVRNVYGYCISVRTLVKHRPDRATLA